MFKYDKNSYANMLQYESLWGTLSVEIYYFGIIGGDATSFFYINGKIDLSNEVLKYQAF